MKRICQRCREIVEREHACRGSSHSRGYDRTWAKFRKYFLSKRRYRCQDCDGIANEVHHIEKVAEHPELRLVEGNCMALCKTCHSVRTARGE